MVPAMGALLRGQFATLRQMLLWIACGYGLAVALSLYAIALFPEGNEFTIMRTCVSKLGSPDPEYNPDGYWAFSAAIVVGGLTMVPLVLYRHRRMSARLGPSKRMRTLTATYLVGVAGFALSGFIPMARDQLVAGYTWDDIHDFVAKTGFIALGFALFIEGLVLFLNAKRGRRGDGPPIDWNRLRWPYFHAVLVGTLAVFFLLSWDIKRAQDPTLRWTGEGLYAFALWEWVLFLSAPLIIAGIALAWMTERVPQGAAETD